MSVEDYKDYRNINLYPEEYAGVVDRLNESYINPEKPNASISFSHSDSETDISTSTSVPITPVKKEALAHGTIIPTIFNKRLELLIIYELMCSRIRVLATEVAKSEEEKKNRSFIIACMWFNIYKLAGALATLYHPQDESDPSKGAYVNAAYYNLIIFHLVDTYAFLLKHKNNFTREVETIFDVHLPQHLFVEGQDWGGVKSSDDRYLVKRDPFTLTQFLCGDFFLFTNNLRLLVVRSKNFSLYLDSFLTTSFPQLDLTGMHSFSETMDKMSPTLTYLSWMYYIPRAVVNLLWFFKHLIPNPWMTSAEENLLLSSRLENEATRRASQLVNDIVWGVIGFIVWSGSCIPVVNSILTAALYLVDVINCLVMGLIELGRLKEVRSQYINELTDIRNKIKNDVGKENYLENRKIWEMKRRELECQLDNIDKKIVDSKEGFAYRLSINNIFLVAMSAVALGFALHCPPLMAVAITVVLGTAIVQLVKFVVDKIKGSQPDKQLQVKTSRVSFWRRSYDDLNELERVPPDPPGLGLALAL